MDGFIGGSKMFKHTHTHVQDTPIASESAQSTLTYILYGFLSLTCVCLSSMRLFYFLPNSPSCPKGWKGLTRCVLQVYVCVGHQRALMKRPSEAWILSDALRLYRALHLAMLLPNTALALKALSPTLRPEGVTLFLWKCVCICVVVNVCVCPVLHGSRYEID